MRLVEANDLSFDDKFKNSKDILEQKDIIKEFCANAGFKNYVKQDWDEFIDGTFSTLVIECRHYGLSMDNPFFAFLNAYNNINGNIKVFNDIDTYNVLHNAVANGILDTKQISFTSAQNEQIRILINPNLWKLSNRNDTLYLIKLYDWFLESDLNRYILNAYVKAAFATKAEIIDNKLNFNTVDFENPNTKLWLMRCVFFTEYINDLTALKIKQGLENLQGKNGSFEDSEMPLRIDFLEDIKAKIAPYNIQAGLGNDPLSRNPFLNVNVIEQQVKTLRELVQESSEDITGRTQETDINLDDEDTYDEGDGLSPKQRAAIKRQQQPVIDAVMKTYNVNNEADIKKVLKALSTKDY